MLDEDLYAESRAAAAAAAGDLLGTLSSNPSAISPAAHSPDDGADVHMADARDAAAGEGSDGRVAGAAALAIDALAPALLKRLDDSSDAVRVAAADALERLAVCLSTAYGRQGLGNSSGPGSSAGVGGDRCERHAAAAAAALLVRAMQAMRHVNSASCRALQLCSAFQLSWGLTSNEFLTSPCVHISGEHPKGKWQWVPQCSSGRHFRAWQVLLHAWRFAQYMRVCRCTRRTRRQQWQPPHAGPHAHSRRPRPRPCMLRR